MKFDKNKDETQNLNILKKEIKRIKSSFSDVLINTLFDDLSSEDFRATLTEKIRIKIEEEIKK
jgi:hypothetical protein